MADLASNLEKHGGDPALSDGSTSTQATFTTIDADKQMESEKDTSSGDEYGGDKTVVAEPPADEYPKGASLALIVFALALAIFLASLDMTIVATAIPKVTDEFHGLDKVSWYGSAFFMTNGGFQSSWGKAYKYFPLTTTLLLAVLVFEVGSLLCGVAPNPEALIVGRAITGVGAAGLGTGVYTIIAFVAEPAKRANFTSIVGLSYGIAAVLGPLIGGAFSDKVSWRWCFYINLPIGGISALIILFFFHAPSGAKPVVATWREKLLQMDFIGVAMVMGAIVSYTLALQYAGQAKAWNSSVVVGLLVGSVVISIAFVAWECVQGERAMVPPRLFRKATVGISSTYTYFFSGSYFLAIYYLPLYFQSVDGDSPAMSGVHNLPLILSVTTSMITSGTIITKFGHANLLMVVGAAIATIAAGLLFTLDIDTSTGKWIGYQIIGGIGWGLSFQVPMIVGQGNADPADLSSITAIVLFFMNLGGTTLISAAQSAFVNTMINVLHTSAPGVDQATVIATGATEIRTVFSADQILGVLVAYMAGLKSALAIAIAATGLAFLVSLLGILKRPKAQTVKSAGDDA
jgi:EmrB/QacA subfamily drug resistance transporter